MLLGRDFAVAPLTSCRILLHPLTVTSCYMRLHILRHIARPALRKLQVLLVTGPNGPRHDAAPRQPVS